MSKMEDEEDGEGVQNLASLLEEEMEELAVQQEGEQDLSDDDDRPYAPGLYYLSAAEWVELDHNKFVSITTDVPGNIMRYVAIQQAAKDTGLQSISTLGPVFNEVTIEFDVEDPVTQENLKIQLRAADQLWDRTRPKGYYLTLSTACDCDLQFDGPLMPSLKSSSDLVVHSVQSTYSNRWGWSPKKASAKVQQVGVAKFSDYSHYRICNIYLGPTVRVKGDKQLVEALNAQLKTATCLHHYRELFNLCLTTPVQDIWEYHVVHDQDKKGEIAFRIAATDCATQVRLPCHGLS